MPELNVGERIIKDGKVDISDIYVGSIDATDEIDISGTADDFYNTYMIPDGVKVDDFLSGRSMFTYGLKGTGKTALLRYIGETIKRSGNGLCDSELFRFGKDFPREIYEDIRSAFFDGVEKPSPDIKFNEYDYEDVWEYILFNQVYLKIKTDCSGEFVNNDKKKELFIKHWEAIVRGAQPSKIMRFLPHISNGKIRVAKDPSIEMDFSFPVGNEDAAIPFHRFMSVIKKHFSTLSFTDKRYYILIDEIDPRIGRGNLFHLDLILIRDLISAVKGLNSIVQQQKRRFFFIAAVRSEVLDSISTLGKEVHKALEQFGVSMNWGESGSVSVSHPLVKMIAGKILYSENKAGIYHSEAVNAEEYVWTRYFKQNKGASLEVKYVFEFTWFRPRDFVRMLSLCKKAGGGSLYFSESLLQKTRKQYSISSWKEIEAQLSAVFNPGEIKGIESILTGFKKQFTYKEFEERLVIQSSRSEDVHILRSRHKVGEILKSLYRNGVIGNGRQARGRSSGYRFIFRGDREAQFDLPFRVHKGLWSTFSILSENRERNRDVRSQG